MSRSTTTSPAKRAASSASGAGPRRRPPRPSSGCTRSSTAARRAPASRPRDGAAGCTSSATWAWSRRSSTSRPCAACRATSRDRPQPLLDDRRDTRGERPAGHRQTRPRRPLALGHNGNLVNADELAAELRAAGVDSARDDRLRAHRRADRAPPGRRPGWTPSARVMPRCRARTRWSLITRDPARRPAATRWASGRWCSAGWRTAAGAWPPRPARWTPSAPQLDARGRARRDGRASTPSGVQRRQAAARARARALHLRVHLLRAARQRDRRRARSTQTARARWARSSPASTRSRPTS